MDTAMTVMEIINPNGTVGRETETYRLSATNVGGDPIGALLQELNGQYPNLCRGYLVIPGILHLKTINTLPINDAVKDNLSELVLKTGYLEDPACRRFRLLIVGKSRNFTGNGIACWGTFTAIAPWIIPNLIMDYIKALQTDNKFQLALPFESKETRDLVLKAITDCPDGDGTGGWGELPAINQEMRASLIEVVTSAGYVT